MSSTVSLLTLQELCFFTLERLLDMLIYSSSIIKHLLFTLVLFKVCETQQ